MHVMDRRFYRYEKWRGRRTHLTKWYIYIQNEWNTTKWEMRKKEGGLRLRGSTFFILNWNEEVESFGFLFVCCCCCYFSHFTIFFLCFFPNFQFWQRCCHCCYCFACGIFWMLSNDPSTFGRLFHFMLAMNNIFKTIKRKRKRWRP